MAKRGAFKKAWNVRVTPDFLAERVSHAEAQGYSKAKWVQFCEAMMAAGYTVKLYEARKTWSKYVTVSNGQKRFKVRFSNHRPIKSRERNNDCDFFVGVAHFGTTTTEQAIEATKAALGEAVQ